MFNKQTTQQLPSSLKILQTKEENNAKQKTRFSTETLAV